MDHEILNSEDMVLWFDDLGTGNEEFNFLSNFYRGELFGVDGIYYWDQVKPKRFGTIQWKTGEHAFAAMKFWGSDWDHFHAVRQADDPNDAKALGRSTAHPIREDWEIVKLDVMAAILRSKFTLDREEGQRLLETGDRMLIEGTYWGDEVWGVDLTHPDFPGRNWLGTLLMARRAELRAMHKYQTSRLLYFAGSTVTSNAKFGTSGS